MDAAGDESGESEVGRLRAEVGRLEAEKEELLRRLGRRGWSSLDLASSRASEIRRQIALDDEQSDWGA